MNCPESIDAWTPDEVAECTDGLTPATYRELWGVLDNERFRKRPLGGDGSNGTTEVPDDFSGSMRDAWPLLSDAAKANIIDATREDEARFQELIRRD